MQFIYKNWAKFGGFLAIVIILYLLYSDLSFVHTTSLLWLHFVTLLIHQFEEYVYPGGFKEFFQENIYSKKGIIRSPLNNKGIIFINIGLGWSAYVISAVHGENSLWLAVGLIGVTLLNGFLHTLLFVIKRKYNPGFVSGLFLCIPFGVYLLSKLMDKLSHSYLISGFKIFALAVVLVPISIFVTNLIKE